MASSGHIHFSRRTIDRSLPPLSVPLCTSLSDPIRFLERLLHVFFPKSQNYLGIKFRKFTECRQINYWHELVELYIFSWPRTRLSYSSPRPFELKVFFRHSSAVIMLYTTFHSFNNAPSLCISHLQFIGTHVWYLNDSYPVATFMSRYTYIHIYTYTDLGHLYKNIYSFKDC